MVCNRREMEMGKIRLLFNSLSLRTWLIIVVALLVIAVALWWFIFRVPSDIGFPALNQEVGKQDQIIIDAQKTSSEAEQKVKVQEKIIQDLVRANVLLEKQRQELEDKMHERKPPEIGDEQALIARFARHGISVHRAGN